MKLTKATDHQRLKQIRELYMDAFPLSERKPFDLMIKKQSQGTMEILALEDENGFLGLAILAFDKDIALLDYFAILADFRGKGIGSKAICALQKRLADKRFILEIETTKQKVPDLEMRKKRKNFYLKNGLHTMDFDVNLFGIEMEILSNCEYLTFEEYLDVYKNACGKQYSNKISLINPNNTENTGQSGSGKITKKLLQTAFLKTLPVMTGYLVLGIGFGILLKKAGYGIFWSFLMSLTIYAGSMQYVAVSMLSTGASFISVALTTFMVNARHLFYGLSMIDKYKNAGKKKSYLIFSLTDETYSLLCNDELPKGEDPNLYRFFVSLFDQCYWIIGCVSGSIIGTLIPFQTAGIEFSMTALFVTVFVEQWLTNTDHVPAMIGLLCSISSLVIFGSDSFLIPAMIAITIFLCLYTKIQFKDGGSANES